MCKVHTCKQASLFLFAVPQFVHLVAPKHRHLICAACFPTKTGKIFPFNFQIQDKCRPCIFADAIVWDK